MGGQVFAGGPNPLYTPRMPPVIYEFVKKACHEKLQQIFEQVATPIEGPEKADFGDIDFLVHGRRRQNDNSEEPQSTTSTSTTTTPQEWHDVVQSALGAQRRFSQQPHAGSFAIPWPTGICTGLYEAQDVWSPKDKPRYIQVDVHVCDTPQTFRWSVFKQDHGDLWNLLGSTIRPYGLTVDHEALHVRIAEIERLDKKKAKVRLSSDPDAVLQFLGLDRQRWRQGFASMQDTYEYAATCRFFWVKPESEGGDDMKDKDGYDDEDRIGGEFTKKKLKSNDRQRMDKRPMFSRWINHFIPSCCAQLRFTERRIDREGTLEEALTQFGVRETYDARILEFRKKRQAETMWKNVIKATIPTDGIDPMFRGCAANGLKKIILHGDESYGVVPSEPLKDETTGLFDEEAVRRFTKAHWKEVGDIGFQRNHEHMLAKKAKLKKEEEAKQAQED
ncbi:hypothetical protein PG985_001956 [Apiospora marii]|uniref:RNA-directed RNA polymerase n=1 Tax=Apiospora marii TaxID=335849 RepID=A0ABR1RY64_9PEZI